MARQFEHMTEDEAREELERRNHHRDRNRREDSGWLDRVGRGAVFGAGYGWPFVPPMYPEVGYGPYGPPPGAIWGRDRMRPHGDWTPRGVEDRDFMDRAGDEIASWFGDEAAHARREADHSGRGPKGYVRSDARIEEDVNDRLTDDPRVDASDVQVSVKDREVTLDGTVETRRAKRRAEDCADSVSGVVHVQNNLRVQTAA